MNSEQQQQRIMGYFIEEAREHLQTIEQGVLNLQDILNDSESMNELFRAAHSIKGGAAMLGVGSIQHVAHRLEDFFKILKENHHLTVDERLKSLLLSGFDPLSELLDELQDSYKISDELTIETNNRVKPVFTELESYLNQLVSDSDGQISNTFSQEEERIPQLQELVVSKQSIFQQEITTKMRDMLQLFRATDNAESRSQLQAICNYFQEVGSNFDLEHWTNLVIQIKNAIAQSSNSYRTLAPILIRELKEAQDLVLANRQAEITVSLQLQNLLPYRFSEPEDDEVSTIFTTASGEITEDSIVDGFDVSDISTTADADLNTDVEIDLFADQVNEESFDLSDTSKSQVDQMDWMDGEYEITENQNIDGPKVGASELKSLAILFENDDIDFDSAWEDIESNETNIANHGATEVSDTHDEFADLLDHNSDNNDVTTINLSTGESSIDQLFGDFSTQDSTSEDNDSSLFPDDLEDSWEEPSDAILETSSDIISEGGQASLDDLFAENFTGEQTLDNQFDLDLGMDIVEQISVEQDSESQVDVALSIGNQFNDSEFSEVDVEENGLGLPSLVDGTEQSADSRLDDTDDSQPLSSEEYFAALARQESAISSNEITDDEFLNSDVDIFFEDSIENTSGDYAQVMSESSDSYGIDTSGLNIFDELGFDNDAFDDVENCQGFVESTNAVSNIAADENHDDFLVAITDALDGDGNASTLKGSDEFMEDPILAINNAELDDSIVDEVASEFVEFIEGDEISVADDFAVFFADSLKTEDVYDSISTDNFGDEFTLTDNLVDFLAESEEPTEPVISNDISDIENVVDEYTSDSGLDFFTTGSSEEPETSLSDINDKYFDGIDQDKNSIDELGDFFADSEKPEAFSDVNNDLEALVDRTDNTDESDDFFNESEESAVISSDIIDNPIEDFEQEFSVTDDINSFFPSLEAPEIPSDILDDPENEFNNTSDLDDFFVASDDPEIDFGERNNELDDPNNFVDGADDLNNVFDGLEEHQNLVDNLEVEDFDEFSTAPINNIASNNLIDVNDQDELESINFDFPQDLNSELLPIVNENITEVNSTDLERESFEEIHHSSGYNLESLFDVAEEIEASGQEHDLNFDQDIAIIPSDDIDDFGNILEEDFQSSFSQSLAVELTTIQENLHLQDEDFRDADAIDNIADFSLSDDDLMESLLKLPEEVIEVISENIAVDEIQSFGEFNESVDLNEDAFEISDHSLSQDLETSMLEPAQLLQTEELNGIDDDFNFDDLESMIGSSSNMPNDIDESIANQVIEPFVDSQTSDSSDDMNFDELEALLGGGGSVVEPEVTQKTTDEFDELESMLQTAFAKDVGPIKTKASARQPATTRKPRLTDSTMRVDVKYLDSLNNLVGELVVNRNLLEQDQERLQQFISNLLHQVQLLSDVSQRMRDQYDRSLLEASLTAGRGGRSYNFDTPSYASDGANANISVTNDFEGIEFDRYNTFHILSQEIIELIVRVRESASDIEFVVTETDQVTRQLGTITTQVQDDLKQSRMVPFAQIADRLPRGIRDRALKTGKQADLEIFGRETLIDKAILEQLTDPLTHLVNNAIDHGLEDPSTRQADGKSATGKLTVRAYHQGNQTVISISDDGAGISPEKVKKSAVSKGVRSQAEVDRLNETEVYSLLFEAGFSTAAKADEFKGRGVGLDVVKTCLDDIRGVIIVESSVGKGTTFTIRLPLTLSISKAMFCISDRARIAFPVDGFEDMVEVPQSQIILNEKGQPCLPWKDTVLPFQHLSNLLSYSRHLSRSSIYGKQENDELCIIILRNDSSFLALQVDQFLGEQEIVIKQLEGPIPQPAGIAGATVLGDGRVMAIANVLELFDIASGRLRPSTSGMTIQPTVEEDVAADPTVLIVDDSITVRELLSLTFAKVGYRVEQAKDGQDAWEKLRAGLPCDMIFCDIEMPRMDGLDLLSRLQKDSRLKEIPVAMLTSRGADRHRQSAIQLGAKGYFTKPYLEEELLSASKRLLAGETLPI
ncbi:MAG: hypothetical protein DCF20_13970 [Pseudanabaena sp.]|nr:MAG: hypothetical protein DCF20_13970 [Pseudanabaena sp.]